MIERYENDVEDTSYFLSTDESIVFLRYIIDSLDDMICKELIVGKMQDGIGGVCLMGAVYEKTVSSIGLKDQAQYIHKFLWGTSRTYIDRFSYLRHSLGLMNLDNSLFVLLMYVNDMMGPEESKDDRFRRVYAWLELAIEDPSKAMEVVSGGFDG